MKYPKTKWKYIYSIIVLFIGSSLLIFLFLFIKPLVNKKLLVLKPVVEVTPFSKFVYLTNENNNTTIDTYDLVTSKTEPIYASKKPDDISSGSLLFNTSLFLHGTTNLGLTMQTHKPFFSKGDYISPDGKNFLSIASNPATGYLTFLLRSSMETETATPAAIPTGTTAKDLHKILGWSADSHKFYYTTTYTITKTASQSATDHWMQKVGKEMKEMSRVRTWVQYSTSSGEKVFEVNIQNKSTTRLFTDSNIGIITNAFYNNKTGDFYLSNDSGLYTTHAHDSLAKKTIFPWKGITTMVFATQDKTNRFLHSDGKSLGIADPDKGSDKGLYYASGSALLTPLALTDNNVAFSLRTSDHYAGEILDIKRFVRTEFVYKSDPQLATSSANPIIFISWIKNIVVKFN